MILIFIYGPPAVGKLTIAEHLSDLTNIPLFHNHLSRDIVHDIYPDSLNTHYRLVDQIRTKVFSYCAKQGTSLIFTFVYEGQGDDSVVESYVKSVESNGGKVKFVELTARREDLLKRVNNESRKQFRKLSDPKILHELTEAMDVFSIPFVDAKKINTSNHNPEESARIIAQELELL